MTSDEIWKLPASVRDILRWDLSRRWRCLGCSWTIVLRVPAVIGHVCCGGCGYAILRPWYLELPPMKEDGLRFLVDDYNKLRQALREIALFTSEPHIHEIVVKALAGVDW